MSKIKAQFEVELDPVVVDIELLNPKSGFETLEVADILDEDFAIKLWFKGSALEGGFKPKIKNVKIVELERTPADYLAAELNIKVGDTIYLPSLSSNSIKIRRVRSIGQGINHSVQVAFIEGGYLTLNSVKEVLFYKTIDEAIDALEQSRLSKGAVIS